MTTYNSLREKIAAESIERRERYTTFAAVYAEAKAAGIAAGDANQPTPMIVREHSQPLNDNSAVSREWFIADGACGFAWVRIRPANSSFARWLIKEGHGRTAYGGGVDIWISEHNQSIGRKKAHARALAAVLKAKLGLAHCYADSRLD